MSSLPTVCRGVKMKVQQVLIPQKNFLTKFGRTEVILGMDWLSSLRKIEVDFHELCFKWHANGKAWEILGDLALCHAQALWKSTLKVLKEDGEGYYITPVAKQQ